MYAIIAIAALVILCAWLIWRCVSLRGALARAQSRAQALQQDRAIRQNLQQVLERREAEIRRLRGRVAAAERDSDALRSRASDLNVELFRESGLRILAEKEEGANRMKLEQLQKQLDDARSRLRAREGEHAETVRQLREQLSEREKELARLRRGGARRARRAALEDSPAGGQVTLDDVLGGGQARNE